MITTYPQAKQMFVAENRVWIGALASVPSSDLSIVIHKTACGAPCTAESVATFFATDQAEASTHFIVGLDGEVVQCVSMADGAGGNCCLEAGHDPYWDPLLARYKNLNLCTFSIEHVDTTLDNSQAPTSAQLASSFNLVLWLCQQFSITPDRIKTHASIDPISRKQCPGNYPMNDLITFVGSRFMNLSQRAAFEKEWRSVVPDVMLTSGIANAAWDDYQQGQFHGPALTEEYASVDWNGTPIIVQITAGGRYEWNNGVGHFFYAYH